MHPLAPILRGCHASQLECMWAVLSASAPRRRGRQHRGVVQQIPRGPSEIVCVAFDGVAGTGVVAGSVDTVAVGVVAVGQKGEFAQAWGQYTLVGAGVDALVRVG